MSGPQPIINERFRSGWDKAFAKKMTKKHGPKKRRVQRKSAKRSSKLHTSAAQR